MERANTGSNKIGKEKETGKKMMKLEQYINSLRCMRKKNRILVWILTILVGISQGLLGIAVEQQDVVKQTTEQYEADYGKKSFYPMLDTISEITYDTLISGKDENSWKKIQNFRKKLENAEAFTFIELFRQPLQIKEKKIPEKCMYGYEECMAEKDGEELEDGRYYDAKSICVSRSFFKTYNIQTEPKDAFSSADYQKEGNVIPVILGEGYRGEFQIGEKFDGLYLCYPCKFEVKGFVKKKNFFYLTMEEKFESCERYMILPSFQVKAKNEFSKIYLIQTLHGDFVTEAGYEKSNEEFEQYKKECGLENFGLSMRSPDYLKNTSRLSQYKAMSKDVWKQFTILIGIVLGTTIFIMCSILETMLDERRYAFGVELLCGASFKEILCEVVGFVCFISLFGDAIAVCLMAVGGVSSQIAGITVQISILLTTLLTSFVCCMKVRQMEVSDIIGGKE